jgi:hypothetical protein
MLVNLGFVLLCNISDVIHPLITGWQASFFGTFFEKIKNM